MRASTRLPALDGLRAIAVLIVMISHSGLGYIVPGGFGVTIFFFLSGYLITTLLIMEWRDSERIDLAGFYFRRLVRIVPPMLIAVGIAAILSAGGYVGPILYENMIWDFLFITNYAPILNIGSSIPIPLWSLDIEEHFYLAFPLLFIFTYKNFGSRNFTILCAVLCAVTLAFRILHVVTSDSFEGIYYWSHTRVDSIIFGCILALWNNPVTDEEYSIGGGVGYSIIGMLLILLTFFVRDDYFRETIRYSIQGVGLFFIFNFALRSSGLVARVLSVGGLRVIADLSYFLYLIHVPMLEFTAHMPGPEILGHLAGIALSFALAAVVRQSVELPLLRWRKRVEAKPRLKVSVL